MNHAAWLSIVGLLAGLSAQAPAPRITSWPDGSVRERVPLDAEGLEHGMFEAYHENGKPQRQAGYMHGVLHGLSKEWDDEGRLLRTSAFQKGLLHGRSEEYHADGRIAAGGTYSAGERSGAWTFHTEDGTRKKTANFKAGVLHGAVRVEVHGKVVSKQSWKNGVLESLDGAQPFPRARDALLAQLRSIRDQSHGALDADDPLAAERAKALRGLQVYRALCELPWEGMSLVPEWNLRCDAAAEVCRRNGKLSHTPPMPPGMDEARFKLGYEGAGSSNLAIDASLPKSVDGYMNDSDDKNIDRVGHRRWCLNPAMKKVGFGSDERFHAMWSMDGSGSMPKGLDVVLYPPRGYVPVDLFGARHAFSVSLVRGKTPKKELLHVILRAVDEDFVPVGEQLELDYCDVATDSYGGSPALIFRPVGLELRPGRRYRVEVSYDGGKSKALSWLVEFTEPLGS